MSHAIEAVLARGEIINPGPLARDGRTEQRAHGPEAEKIIVIEDEYFVREGICGLLRDAGWDVEAFSSCEDFLGAFEGFPSACIVLDIHFPGMDGLELLRRMRDVAYGPPIIVVSGSSGISEAVQSMKQGALDFIEKPIVRDVLIASVRRALDRNRRYDKLSASREAALGRLTGLTARQRQIMELVLAGQPSKIIAADLGISQRTVETHRASIMRRTRAHSLPALAQLEMASRWALDM